MSPILNGGQPGPHPIQGLGANFIPSILDTEILDGVIDVDAKSSRYGKVLYQLDLGSAGNETHHFGFTDDRTHIWGCSLFSNRTFIINVADDPARIGAVVVIFATIGHRRSPTGSPLSGSRTSRADFSPAWLIFPE